MPDQLHQIIALEKGIKTRVYADLTAAHRGFNEKLLAGLSRTYRPKDEDGDRLPSESTMVQLRAHDVLADVERGLIRLIDITVTKDTTNCEARADIEVNETTLATDVPVTTLLFLEKQLNDLHTFITKLPVLDPADTWTFNENLDAYATEPTETARTKKIPRNHVKWTPPDKGFSQPAQVEMYFEDQVVGWWNTVKHSGALPQKRVTEMAERVVKLRDAVKVARSKANTTPVVDRKIGASLLGYVFSP